MCTNSFKKQRGSEILVPSRAEVPVGMLWTICNNMCEQLWIVQDYDLTIGKNAAFILPMVEKAN